MTIEQLADKYLPYPENKKVLTKYQGNTDDIIAEVLDCYHDTKEQLKKFAPYLKGSTTLETCRNIWNFWKSNIRYQVDAEGVQWVKTPAAVWSSKFCDCKSFSVAVAATMYCLGIDGAFRFTSYGSNTTVPTHVYVVAHDGRKKIIIDCVWRSFNSEKPYAKKWEYNMTNVYRLSGTDEVTTTVVPGGISPKYAIGQLNIDPNDAGVTEGELDLALTIQGLELEQQVLRQSGVYGIGSHADDNYQVLIEGHRNVLQQIVKRRKGIRPLTKEQRIALLKQKLSKNPLFKNKLKKLAAANPTVTGVDEIGFLKKIGKAIKKVAKKVGKGVKNLGKAITKVAKTPFRLAAQGALKSSGAFFLYLFIDTKKIPEAKLPEAVRIKRAKAMDYRKRIVGKLQMPSNNFDKIVRNAIMTTMGNTPENIIASWIQQSGFKVSGIGAFKAVVEKGAQILSAVGPALKNLFGKLGQQLGEDVEQFSPSPEDWGILSADQAQAQAMSMQLQQGNGGGGAYYGNSGGNYSGYGNDNYSYADRTEDSSSSQEPTVWTTNTDEEGNVTGYTNMETGVTVPPDQKPYTGNGKNVIQEPEVPVYGKMAATKDSGSGLLLLGLAAAVVMSNK